MPRYGKCSICKVLHPAPFGVRCIYVKDAKKYCQDKGLPEMGFYKHIDFAGMPKFKEDNEVIEGEELDEKDGILDLPGAPLAEDSQVKELVRINLEQQDQIRLLISRMDSLTTMAEEGHTKPVSPVAAGDRAGVKPGIMPAAGGLALPPPGGQPGWGHVTAAGHSPVVHHVSTSRGPMDTGGQPVLSDHSANINTGASSVAPSEFVQGPLTHALDRLSMAIDPAIDLNTQGITLRPEYFVQYRDNHVALKNVDHNKLTYNSLVYGMCRIVKQLYVTEGDVRSYLDHMLYVTKLASLGEYTDSAFIGYDRAVIDAVISKDIPTFVAGYQVAASLNFHSSNLIRNQTERQSQNFRGRGRGRGRWVRSDKKPSTIPEGFPENVCYDFNYKTCDGCAKNHTCRICAGIHKAINCPKKRENKDN